MRIRQGLEEKSRLGRLLVNRGYLSEAQVEEGLRLQHETGQRLGEIFVQNGWISERELHRVLKHQSRYRNAAALVTLVTLPFQPLVTLAAGSQGASASQQSQVAGELYGRGLSPISDEELGRVAGQADPALLERAQRLAAMAANPSQVDGEGGVPVDAVEGIKFAANVFVPVLNFLDSDLSISGVHYREGEPRYEVRADGAVSMALPERIEEIRMDNIRVAGSASAALGNVSLQDIRFHPDSRMTFYTR